MKNKKWLSAIISFLGLMVIPSAFAYHSGISALDTAIEVVGRFFYIDLLNRSTVIQTGFLKFMIFVTLFAVTNMVLKKIESKGGRTFFDKKTAGIVAFAFSAIGTFMMPAEWLMLTGGLIAVIMSSVIFLGFFLGLSYVAMALLKGNKMKHAVGLALLFLLLFILSNYIQIIGVVV